MCARLGRRWQIGWSEFHRVKVIFDPIGFEMMDLLAESRHKSIPHSSSLSYTFLCPRHSRSHTNTMSNSIVKRIKTLPYTLYRIQSKLPVNLRDYAEQQARGRESFHLKTDDQGLVHPAKGDTFIGPNGLSLRPPSDSMYEIAKKWRGSPTVYRLSATLELPDHLVILQEHSDHYSLQTTEPVPLYEFNHRLTEFLESLPSQTLEQFIEQLEDEDDQDN